MKALVVHFSQFGHTHAVADAIADVLRGHYEVRTLGLDALTEPDLQGADLVVMGSPTHRMNLPQAVRPLLEALPKRVLKRKPVAAFDTSYKMSPWLSHFTAAKKLARVLRKLGGRRILPPETFHVVGREGPLYDGEIDRARGWARALLGELTA